MSGMGLELDSELQKMMSPIFLMYKNLGKFFRNIPDIWRVEMWKIFQ